MPRKALNLGKRLLLSHGARTAHTRPDRLLRQPTMTEQQLSELRRLEQRIFDCGIDGGLSTSDAIDRLRDKEKELGVYDENVNAPRWLTYRRCEICSEPATCATRDVYRESYLGDYSVSYSPCGGPSFYCQEHDREPEIYDIHSIFTTRPDRLLER